MSIRIVAKPDHFIEGVVCPFCQKPTLGVVPVPVDENITRYGVTCLYSDCVLNFTSRVSWELDHIIKDMVATGTLKQ